MCCKKQVFWCYTHNIIVNKLYNLKKIIVWKINKYLLQKNTSLLWLCKQIVNKFQNSLGEMRIALIAQIKQIRYIYLCGLNYVGLSLPVP